MCLITNPVWLIKTRLQLQQKLKVNQDLANGTVSPSISTNYPLVASEAKAGSTSVAGRSSGGGMGTVGAPNPAPYRGMLDAFIRIGREEGLRGYFKGLGPSLVLVRWSVAG